MLPQAIKPFIVVLLMFFSSTTAPSFAIEDSRTTLLFGNPKSGKSTFTHLLCGKQLLTYEGIFVAPDSEKIEDIKISDSMIEENKAVPVYSLNKKCILDCPPFKKSSRVLGLKENLADERVFDNSETIRRALEGKVNVILIVHESDLTKTNSYDFLNSLQILTNFFPDPNELRNMMSLVVSHKPDKADFTGVLLQRFLDNSSITLKPKEKNLVEFFIQNKNNRERVVDFNIPSKTELYVVPDRLKMFIDADRPYVEKPKIAWPSWNSIDIVEGYW